ncbi:MULTISPECIES: LacI family DNA-binding transcriptional regulator [Micromonosporaceae]|uniref:LacI family DNA-binding transcriptional regulator n=1 Tax=Micromonosporaceae TaxID=28056 RepID=UPI000F474119|nr:MULTISPECIES: LacI family DNA-binding transcriptional regulator [Micromonosporaceae]MDG4770068.1 LacI family DNA-binding transcriptional regulator [Solwaraspora sp. WMMD792]ROO59017.1 LacI family transcriptional regulator [Micromonospora sp. Llam0]WBB98749.1 LacI family DNA-binding transcriptional regulator [Solwaraspora sp. WMMA2059]WBC22698.1 LacI family DNA-binding transcriptional regulator [Solwaraspora sp. WMMA2080]WFE19499.1 LacI family DNA-binding transcriptional regulator [Solwarasp
MTTQRTRSLGRPTLDAVAARAGVGRGTVSRVVNGSPQVSPEARAAVQQAIAELGYVPNRAARALVTQRTDSVALVVSESEERVFGEPFFAGIVRGISSGLLDTPMQLWLAMAQSPAERERVEHHLTNQHVDGVLLLSLHDADPLPTLLEQRGLPSVLGGRPARMLHPDARPAYFVDVDNAGGARLAVEYLLAGGRRRVATIAGPQDMGVGVARLTGYHEAIRHSGPPGGESLVAYGDFSEGSGTAAMRQLLERHPDLDAVFVASDLMACGALRALREAGRRVPDDVAVVGFEDAPIARQSDPPLTTVFQPVEEMGRQMARLLLSRIRHDELQVPYVLLETHMVARDSA